MTVHKTEYEELGREELKKGKVGALILAAGDGMRLGASLPKALFPLFNNLSLLEIQMKKMVSKIEKNGWRADLAILCSETNYSLIENHLKEREFFGCNPASVELLIQKSRPLFSLENGKKKRLRSRAPEGNGAVFDAAKGARFLQGKEQITITPIDNPLGDPLSCALIGFHKFHKHEISLIAIREKFRGEKLGKVHVKEKRVSVSEYFEQANESSLFNTGLFSFDRRFFESISSEELPLHEIIKEIRGLMLLKYERFIFDALARAEISGALVLPRSLCYAALKEREGISGIKAVRRETLRQERELIRILRDSMRNSCKDGAK